MTCTFTSKDLNVNVKMLLSKVKNRIHIQIHAEYMSKFLYFITGSKVAKNLIHTYNQLKKEMLGKLGRWPRG